MSWEQQRKRSLALQLMDLQLMVIWEREPGSDGGSGVLIQFRQLQHLRTGGALRRRRTDEWKLQKSMEKNATSKMPGTRGLPTRHPDVRKIRHGRLCLHADHCSESRTTWCRPRGGRGFFTACVGAGKGT